MTDVILQLCDEEVAQFWDHEGLTASADQLELIQPLRHWLEKREKTSLGSFLVGKPVDTIGADDPGLLAGYVLARFRPISRGVAALLVLGKLIDRNNVQGTFQLCPPPAPLLLKRKASPFAESRWPLLDVGPILRSVLEASILKPATLPRNRLGASAVAQVALGQLLVSCIVHGGLLHASLLEALLRKLVGVDVSLDCLGQRVFVEMSVNWRNQTDAEFRRWFPDPLSAILLMQLPREAVLLALNSPNPELTESLKPAIWNAIRAFLRHTGTNPDGIPPSLPKVLDAVRLDLDTRLPIVLVNYAARSLVSHSLKPSVWRRLHGIAVETRLDDVSGGKKRSQAAPGGIPTDVTDTAEAEPRWLTALREAMHGEDRLKTIARIDELIRTPAPGFEHDGVGELFARFALRTLDPAYGNRGQRSIRTARDYVVSLAKRLGGLMGIESVSNLDGEVWTSFYEEAISDAETPGVRRKLIRLLREFHEYLATDRGVAPIEAREVFGVTAGLVPVDANIISDAEFQRIRQRFATGMSEVVDPAVEQIAWLILTLSYRCGLRRMEVLKLELDDLLLEAPAELLVRPTAVRRLKSKSSTRKVPLYALLEPDELDRLRAWLVARRADESKQPFSRFAFAAPKLNFQFIPQDTLFPLLHSIMREVTGDPTLRFHHLRHSFASTCFLRLAASMLADPRHLAMALPAFAPQVNTACDFRQKLYGNAQMTRRDLWAVAALLGHSGPDVSLEHYVHLLDVILAERLAASEAAPSIASVIAASGKSSTQAYKQCSDKGVAGWVAHLWGKANPRQKITAGAPVIPQQTLEASLSEIDKVESADSAANSLLRIWRLLLLHETRGLELAEIASRHRADPKALERYVLNAHWLSELKMSPEGSTYRHRFRSWAPDKREPDKIRRIACPVKPHEGRDLEIIRTLGPRFREAFRNDRPLIMRVLIDFGENSNPDFPGMIFKDPEKPERAIEFVQFLTLLGIEKKNVCFISFDVKTMRSKPFAKWKLALGLRSTDGLEKRTPLNGRKDWACRWIGIEPVFPKQGGNRSGAAAFRYLMVMALIAARTP